jgi:molecular chaperone DnaK
MYMILEVNECDRVINFCGFMIPQLQQERLQNLSQELQFAINTNNLSSMELQVMIVMKQIVYGGNYNQMYNIG